MSLEDLARLIANPSIEFRPELRWWLAEGLHTDETLIREIDTAHRLGFGGMEFLAMDEGDIDHSRYGWGAEEWVHDSQVVVEETTKRNMSVSFTSGTNWSNANLPTIDPDHPAAAQELDVAFEDLAPAYARSGAAAAHRSRRRTTGLRPPRPPRQGHPAAPGGRRGRTGARDHRDGRRARRRFRRRPLGSGAGRGPRVDRARGGRLAAVRLLDARHRADRVALGIGQLHRQLPRSGRGRRGDRLLGLRRAHAGAARADRAQPAGADVHGLPRAVDLRRRRDVLGTHRRRGVPHPSWLRHHAVAAVPGPDRADDGRRHDLPLRRAARSTASRSRRCASTTCVRSPTSTSRTCCVRSPRSCTTTGIELRAEISYGLPFELTRPGPEVDGIETESLEFGSQIDAYRLMAGPAHLFGKQYSSETGATTRNHILDHRFYDQIIATQLAAGITKTVLHGWASTAGAEGVTEWPGHEGMWPMFSERFDTRQPGAEFYPLWNDAIGRYQCVLRQGKPRIDVGILRTDHFTDNIVGAGLRRARTESASRTRRPTAAGGCATVRTTGGRTSACRTPAGPTSSSTVRCCCARTCRSRTGWCSPTVRATRRSSCTRASSTRTPRRRFSTGRGRDSRSSSCTARESSSSCRPVSTGSTSGRRRARRGWTAVTASSPRRWRRCWPCRPSPRWTTRREPSRRCARLGVAGRAEFTSDNRSVLSHLREDGELLHLYLYHFLYETGEPVEVEVALSGAGAAYRIDGWTGDIRPHRGVRRDGDRTLVTVTLAPGETALFTLDRSAAHAADSAAATAGDGGRDPRVDDRGRELGCRRAPGASPRTVDSGTRPARCARRRRSPVSTAASGPCVRGRTSPKSVPRSAASASTPRRSPWTRSPRPEPGTCSTSGRPPAGSARSGERRRGQGLRHSRPQVDVTADAPGGARTP